MSVRLTKIKSGPNLMRKLCLPDMQYLNVARIRHSVYAYCAYVFHWKQTPSMLPLHAYLLFSPVCYCLLQYSVNGELGMIQAIVAIRN